MVYVVIVPPTGCIFHKLVVFTSNKDRYRQHCVPVVVTGITLEDQVVLYLLCTFTFKFRYFVVVTSHETTISGLQYENACPSVKANQITVVQ